MVSKPVDLQVLFGCSDHTMVHMLLNNVCFGFNHSFDIFDVGVTSM